jgi:copper homeostasis protein
MTQLEIAACSLEDALQAEQGGADSIEISVDLAHDGLTPPPDLVAAIGGAVRIPAYVMVRPHARDFVYDADDVAHILDHTRQFARSGVSGIVFGGQTPAGDLDIALIRRVAAVAGDVPVTVHRALDTCANPDAALRALVGVVPRILTAGPAAAAWAGRAALRRWVADYGSHFAFVASGGIVLEQVGELAAYTGVPVCHCGRAARTNGVVDAAKVRALRERLTTLHKP